MIVLALLAGCAPEPVGDDTAAPPGPPDPSVYDCRATGIPARVNPVDPACATDRACETRLVAGHRGMGGEMGVMAPENTVSATRAAVAWGLDFVETDPRPTADGVLVNVHDTDLERVTGVYAKVDELTLAEVRALPLLTDEYPGDFSCERIATLAEILETARGRVHVLVDANKTGRVDLLVAAIVEADALDWAIFDTSDTGKVAEALAIEPRLHTMIRPDTKAELDAQLALFPEHPPVIVEIDPFGVELAADVLAAGHRPFVDVFLQDPAAALQGDLSGYEALYAQGLRVLQSDRPDLVVTVAR